MNLKLGIVTCNIARDVGTEEINKAVEGTAEHNIPKSNGKGGGTHEY